jgi:hypothetical protein
MENKSMSSGNEPTTSSCVSRVDTNEYCSEAEVDKIQSLEEEVRALWRSVTPS